MALGFKSNLLIQHSIELLERMGGKHYYPDADVSEALKRSKKYKRGQ